MNARRLLKAFIAIQLLATAFAADRPCEQPSGHFHQVTRLRGTVVGVNASDWRHAVRWFRQRASVGDAKLTLYEYRAPLRPGEDMRIVKVARTNKHGVFDFGVLPKGHYTLQIDDSWGGETRFDVEITSLPKPVDIVMIDVSPLYPDCTGGREFTAIAR